MTVSPVKFTAGTPGHDYSVERRTDGRFLGQVTKRSQSYNLARPVTVHYWIAQDAAGQSLRGSDNQSTKFSTRAEAAQALLDAVSVRIVEPTDESVVEHINAEDAVTITPTANGRSAVVTLTGGTDALGRVYPGPFGEGWTALLATGETLQNEDGESITYPTRGEAARAIFAHLRAEDDAAEAEFDDECEECGEPRDLNDDGTLDDCQVCLEAFHRQQEAETARIDALCEVAAQAHHAAMNTKGRGKGAAFAARADALDAVRVAALPEEANNVDALDLALGGTTVEAIEHRYRQLQAEHLADELTDGAVVRFRPGAMPSCEGVNFLVDGPVRYDNSRGGRPFVWLRADDESGRSAYVDALVLVTAAEATL